MKLAVFSDVHGNYRALEAFLDYMKKYPVDAIIGLGDYVTDNPYPQRTMEILYKMQREHNCYLLRGNREEYMLENVDNCMNWRLNSSATGMLLHTLQNLTPRDLEFFGEMPSERELKIEEYPILYLCHGTPGKIRGNVVEEAGLQEQMMTDLPYPYLLGGHSHRQELYVQEGKTYLNPGSLGLAFDGIGGNAQFALLTGAEGDWKAELMSIPYDVESYLREFEESGEIGLTLNKSIRKSLRTGVNYFYKCILALQAVAEQQGYASLEEIPETEWEKLAEQFEL